MLFVCLLELGCRHVPRTPPGSAAIEPPGQSPGRHPFALCTPPDRSIAVGEEPVDLAVLPSVTGTPRLVVANAGSDDLSLVGRDGERWLEIQRIKSSPAPIALAIADVNADSHPDVIAIHRTDLVASVHLGAPDGTLGPLVSVPLDRPALALTAADLDGDGDVELAITSGERRKYGVLHLFTLDGAGTIRDEVRYEVHPIPIAVAAGDIRGDPGRELAVFHQWWPRHEIVSPGRPRRPEPERSAAAVTPSTTDGVLADLLGDGHLEAVVVSMDDYAEDPGKLVVYRDEGFDEFMARATVLLPQAPNQVLVHDIDGDGHPEVLAFLGIASLLERLPNVRLPSSLPPLDPAAGYPPPVLQVYRAKDTELELRAEVAADGLSFVAQDLTSDGSVDLAAVQGRLHVHSSPFVTRSRGPELADGMRSLSALDIDGDGDDEVVVERADGCSRLLAEGSELRLVPLERDEASRGRCARTAAADGATSAGTPPLTLNIPHSRERVLGPLPIASDQPPPVLIALRETDREVNWNGFQVDMDSPELHLYLARGTGKAVRVGTLVDDDGERTGSYVGLDGVSNILDLRHSSDVAEFATGDFDRDGNSELVLVDRRRQLYVLWGQAGGLLAAPVRWSVGHVQSLAIGDLDGDGFDELVTLSDRAAVIRIYAPTDTSTPRPGAVFGVGVGAHRVAIGVIDDDRGPEIVYDDRFTREFEVLRLSPCSRRPTRAAI